VEEIYEAMPEEIKSDPAKMETSNSQEEPLNLETLEAAKPADAPESMPATPEIFTMPLASAAFAFLSRGVRELDRTRGEEGVCVLNMKLEIHNCRVIRHQKNTWTSFASFACEMVAHHSKLLMRLNRLRLFWEFRMGFIFVFRSLFSKFFLGV